MKKLKFTICLLLFLFICGTSVIKAQMITVVWAGKTSEQKVEVKIILKEGSLTGSAYYYESPNNYQRYSIRGYFDAAAHKAVWWDDQLIEETGSGHSKRETPSLPQTHFNCPGYGRIILGGRASKIDNSREPAGEMDPDKMSWATFTDPWDFVLENFTVEDYNPANIDSIDLVAAKKPIEVHLVKPLRQVAPLISMSEPIPPQIELAGPGSAITVLPVDSINLPGIEQKYMAREKVFAIEIPVSGDSIELRFYDNAQVDGDSISLFLNDKLIFENIRLSDKAYSVKLAVRELNSYNELTMVAENLGSIPPNTSYMVATVGDIRYEARLESTEGSSALIRLVKLRDER